MVICGRVHRRALVELLKGTFIAYLLVLLWMPAWSLVSVVFGAGEPFPGIQNSFPYLVCWLPETLLFAAMFATIWGYATLMKQNLGWQLRAAGASRLAVVWPAVIFGVACAGISFWANDRVVPAAWKARAALWKSSSSLAAVDLRDRPLLVFDPETNDLLVADSLGANHSAKAALWLERGPASGGPPDVYYGVRNSRFALGGSSSDNPPSQDGTVTPLSKKTNSINIHRDDAFVVEKTIFPAQLDFRELSLTEEALRVGWRNARVVAAGTSNGASRLQARIDWIFSRALFILERERCKRCSVSLGCLCLALAGCKIALGSAGAWRLPITVVLSAGFLCLQIGAYRVSMRFIDPVYFDPRVSLWIVDALVLAFVVFPPKSLWWRWLLSGSATLKPINKP